MGGILASIRPVLIHTLRLRAVEAIPTDSIIGYNIVMLIQDVIHNKEKCKIDADFIRDS